MHSGVRWTLALPLAFASVTGSGCTTADKTVNPTLTSTVESATSRDKVSDSVTARLPLVTTADNRLPSGELSLNPPSPDPVPPQARLRSFPVATRSGTLQAPSLTEVSGMISSTQMPGVLYAVNDSGNSATLHALTDNGESLANWQIDAHNRDWEDMARVRSNDTHYLVIGDTGDNLRVHKRSVLHFIKEPALGTPHQKTLVPALSISFTYEDGPRNVEAFAITDNTVFLISKEPVTARGAQPSRLYTLSLDTINWTNATHPGNLVARYAGDLPTTPPNLEARLAASLAGVDLNHPTALDFDHSGNHAYVLTYRHVIRFTRTNEQSWPEVFAAKGTRVHAHNLEQAEALTVDSGRAVFFTSENASAPVWALPISPPL